MHLFSTLHNNPTKTIIQTMDLIILLKNYSVSSRLWPQNWQYIPIVPLIDFPHFGHLALVFMINPATNPITDIIIMTMPITMNPLASYQQKSVPNANNKKDTIIIMTDKRKLYIGDLFLIAGLLPYQQYQPLHNVLYIDIINVFAIAIPYFVFCISSTIGFHIPVSHIF